MQGGVLKGYEMDSLNNNCRVDVACLFSPINGCTQGRSIKDHVKKELQYDMEKSNTAA